MMPEMLQTRKSNQPKKRAGNRRGQKEEKKREWKGKDIDVTWKKGKEEDGKGIDKERERRELGEGE